MPSPRKMPEGKNQFGIIVPTDIHTKAKHMAADEDVRISEIYTRGIEALEEAVKGHRSPEEVKLVKKITTGIDKKDWIVFEAVSEFLRSKPAPDKLSMFRLILGKFLPEETELKMARKQA